MTTVTDDMIHRFITTYNDNHKMDYKGKIRAGLAAAFDAAAPGADPLARRVEILEQWQADRDRETAQVQRMLGFDRPIDPTPSAPDAEDAAEDAKWEAVVAAADDAYSLGDEPSTMRVVKATVAKAVELGLVKTKLVVTDDLYRRCSAAWGKDLDNGVGLEDRIHNVLIRAAEWGGEEA